MGFYAEFFSAGKYTSAVQGIPSNTSAGTFRFSTERRSTIFFRESTLSTSKVPVCPRAVTTSRLFGVRFLFAILQYSTTVETPVTFLPAGQLSSPKTASVDAQIEDADGHPESGEQSGRNVRIDQRVQVMQQEPALVRRTPGARL